MEPFEEVPPGEIGAETMITIAIATALVPELVKAIDNGVLAQFGITNQSIQSYRSPTKKSWVETVSGKTSKQQDGKTDSPSR